MNKFTCALCKKQFENLWTDEDARQEAVENGFDKLPEEDLSVVCDDCYRLVMSFQYQSNN